MQEIPEDGTWLKICWNDASAPLESTIIKTNVKYEVEHPDVSQLEVQLIHDGVSEPLSLWDKQKTETERETFGKAIGLETFKGSAGIGNWYLLIRDTVPDGAGKLVGFTIIPFYYLEGPQPELVSEGVESVETSAFRIPPDAAPITVEAEETEKNLQVVLSEYFQGAFPTTQYWAVYDNNPYDNKQYLWDEDDLRGYNSTKSAWPANGGTHGILNPITSTTYPPNMNSLMVYGPFSLSNAATAQVTFRLWHEMEVGWDVLDFGVSTDGVNFSSNPITGNSNGWDLNIYSLNSYVGEPNVWVAWKFTSDGSVEKAGPWLDAIVIDKEVPGYVTVNGTLTYQDRYGVSQLGRHTSASLYEYDPGGTDTLLATTSTNGSGYYSFPAQLNWDYDGDPSNRNLDLYVVFTAIHYDIASTYHTVEDMTSGEAYTWNTSVSSNVSSIVLPKNLYIAPSTVSFTNTYRAMWIFQDLRRAWQYIYNQSAPYYINPGSVKAKWKHLEDCYTFGCNAYSVPGYLFIPHTQVDSADIVIHEAGHRYLMNANGPYAYGFCPLAGHNINGASNQICAWNEGWPDFLPIVVNFDLSSTDVCYDFNDGHCEYNPPGTTNSINLETLPSTDSGDDVEGWVAGALLDLFDSANEGKDSASFGFNEIAKVALLDGPFINQFSDFWYYWKDNGFDKHNAVRAIYQNTIDYNDTPVLNLPDWDVPHNSTWPNAFYLPNYVTFSASL